MRLRFHHAILCALPLVACALLIGGCDLSSDPDEDGTGTTPPVNPGGGTGGGPLISPILFGIDPSLLCVGDEIVLTGVNFSQDLTRNKVNFQAGTRKIPALPLRVEFPTDGNAQNGLESRLLVRVPGGTSSGSVELIVDGVFAGATNYEACPQLMAYTLQRDQQGRFLPHLGILGFDPTNSFVQLYGTGLNEIQEVVLEDSTGQTQTIPSNTIERNPRPPGAPGPTGQVPTGYMSIGFSLSDQVNNVQLSISQNRRDNIRAWVRTPQGDSNSLQIPVVNLQNVTNDFGAAINTVKMETGVRTGNVRIYYGFYDLQDTVDASYTIRVDWSVDDGASWNPAAYDPLDSMGSGTTGVLPGTIPHTSQHRLFPGGGAVRVFTWNAPLDGEFIRLNTVRPGEEVPPRTWTVRFRITPQPEGNTVGPINHVVHTPPILYYYLEDREGEDLFAERNKIFQETFLTDEDLDTQNTTASWGPPNNPDALIGRIEFGAPGGSQFGLGTEDLILRNLPPEDLPLNTVDQFYEIDTDLMAIIYHQLVDVDQDPNTPADDVTFTLDFANPGREIDEFHVRRLFVCPDVKVFAQGPNPVIFRMSGLVGGPPVPTDDPCLQLFGEGTAFGMAGDVDADLLGSFFDLNGEPGQEGVDDLPINQTVAGGQPGPGGGRGGDGGNLEVAAGGALITVTHAEAGGNDGGGAGETTGGFDATFPGNRSQYPGAAGGGGGHRLFGGTGDPGTPQPARYQPPRGGLGGVSRGDAKLLQLTEGSGGGGGGASVVTADLGQTWVVSSGAGGGGGGGAFKAVVNGDIEFDTTARIFANGGNGGDNRNAGPGGGGSGGSILLRAAGTVLVDCVCLEVDGGLAGVEARQNREPGAGDGAPGWIRLESGSGGVPTCSSLAATTELTGTLSSREDDEIEVESTAGFPQQGTVIIDGEEIAYQRTTPEDPVAGNPGLLEVLIRGDDAVSHSAGTPVVLKGAIFPYDQPEVWSEGAIVGSPDLVMEGRGRDGELHLGFEPGVDPTTGLLTRDPDTDEIVSIWVFDTDLGVIINPRGNVFLEVASSETDPGFLDLTRLEIDSNTILRGRGARAMRISVAGQADIAGRIDASGFDGGLLRFQNSNPAYPLPGLGGAGGPGAPQGGSGGYVVFANGDPTDKSPENVTPINGTVAGRVPGLSLAYDETPVPYGNGNPQNTYGTYPAMTRALPGLSVQTTQCGGPGEIPCLESGGGGGGGGNLAEGEDGNALPLPDDRAGEGGSIFGNETFRFEGSVWLYGGTAGSGGGASPNVSAEYAAGIPGAYVYKARAEYAPGTGGGGGGGALHLVASNLLLRSTARLLARGGDAYQSIDLGGNGGAGAGGNVFIQVRNAFTVEQGAVIDVSGGAANQPVPPAPGNDDADYEGNVRSTGGGFAFYGGNGGKGSHGRIRIEADLGSMALVGGTNSSISAGPFLPDAVPTTASSTGIRIGLGPGSVCSTPMLQIGSPVVTYFRFGQPLGTDSVVLWEGAPESLDIHGASGTFTQSIRDPEDLRDNEFVQFTVEFLSNGTTGETQSIDDILLPYFMEGLTD